MTPASAAVPSPPGPRGLAAAPTVLSFLRDPLATMRAAAAEYGDVVHVRAGTARVFLLVHPDAVKDVLVTHHRRFTGLAFEAAKRLIGEGLLSAQGAAHRRQRRLVQPAFHRDRMAGYAATMAEHAERWAAGRRDGDELAIRDEMMRLTLGIVGETMFGAAEGEAAEEVRALLDAGFALFGPFTAFAARQAERLPLPRPRRFTAARAALDARVFAMLGARRADPEDRGDLLSMLLAAQDAGEGDDAGGGGLTDRQIRDEVVTIFLAGHETTASALTWAWSLLAANPDAERRLHAELDAVLGGRAPVAADLPRLPYAAAVFAEALRLYPTIPMIFRRALEEHEAGGYRIPRGAVVILSQYVTQRDARFFPDPEAFRPERWLEGARGERPRHAYFPFGGGPRVCIGEHFAAAEGALVLASVASRWRLVAGPGPAPVPDPRFGTRPSDALRMRVAARRDAGG